MFYSVTLYSLTGSQEYTVIAPEGVKKVEEWARSECSRYGFRSSSVGVKTYSSELTAEEGEKFITLI